MFDGFFDRLATYTDDVWPVLVKDVAFLALIFLLGISGCSFLSWYGFHNEVYQAVAGKQFLGHLFPQDFTSSVNFASTTIEFYLYAVGMILASFFWLGGVERLVNQESLQGRSVCFRTIATLGALIVVAVGLVFIAWRETVGVAEPIVAFVLLVFTSYAFVRSAKAIHKSLVRLLNKSQVGQSISDLVFALLFLLSSISVGSLYFSVKSPLRHDLIKHVCASMRMVAIQLSTSDNISGWLLGEIEGRIFIREKIDFGLYQTTAIQNSAVLKISDDSHSLYPSELRGAFSKCE